VETKELKDRIDSIVRPVVEDMGYELILTEWTTDRGHPLVRLYIDSLMEDKRVTIQNCTQVSRQVGAVLDVEDPIPEKSYRLEVSSPGIDRPLTKVDHFKRFVGHKVKVRLKKEIVRNRKNYKGLIKNVSKNELTLEIDNELHTMALCEIDKANLVGELK